MDWPSIIREHGSAVLAVTVRILGPGADAEDVSQYTFFDAFRIWQRSGVENWGGLLRSIARRRAIDCLRRRRDDTPLLNEPSSESASPSDRVAAEELKQAVRYELAGLPTRQAEVFAMRYFENLSNLEIAEALDVSESSVSTALSKARSALSKKLAHLRCGDIT